ncbi:hypothetical protein D3C86_1378970 [compost metagenome]
MLALLVDDLLVGRDDTRDPETHVFHAGILLESGPDQLQGLVRRGERRSPGEVLLDDPVERVALGLERSLEALDVGGQLADLLVGGLVRLLQAIDLLDHLPGMVAGIREGPLERPDHLDLSLGGRGGLVMSFRDVFEAVFDLVDESVGARLPFLGVDA